nr:metal-dependent hydrolase [uncultured Sphingomonas sp.]
MDNFTHSLAGWAIGQTGLKTKTRKGLAALILGANMPDIDVFFGGSCWAPLATHRGFTHGLVGGVLLLPPVLAALLWLLDRWQVKRGAQFASGLSMNVPWLIALCYIGAITHPLLDLQNTYAVQLLSPLDLGWFHNDALFIIDAWVWLILCLGIGISRFRERAGQFNWRKPAIIAVATVIAYIGGNTLISQRAKAQLIAERHAKAPDAVFASPQPIDSLAREMMWREDGIIHKASWTPWGGFANFREPYPDNMRDPLAVEGMRSSKELIGFFRWSVTPTAVVKREGCSATVIYGDARYSDRMSRNAFERVAHLRNDAPGCRNDQTDPPLATSRPSAR